MNTRYSKSTGTFYPLDLDYGSNLPADVIEVSLEDFGAAMARPTGHTFDFVDGHLVITAPHPLTLDQVKAVKLSELAVAFTQRISVIRAGYPDDEITSWPEQKVEATAFTADASANVPLLSHMAAARGITVADLASRVLANASAWATMSGGLIGKRQKYEDAVNAAADAASVAAIAWVD